MVDDLYAAPGGDTLVGGAIPMKLEYIRKGEWLELRRPAGPLTKDQWKELLLQEHRFPKALLTKLEHGGGLAAEPHKLLLRLFPEERAAEVAQWADLTVLYEDDFCLVVNKPAGMPVHPARPGLGGTLANAVASYYEHTGQACRIRHIHRLDEDTTGPVLYAKNEFAHITLDGDMREKKIQRSYIAVAQGRVAQASGVIDQPIGKDRHHPNRRRISPTGDPARTRYKVLEQAEGASLVELRLETGRTHQIRVHLLHLGTPIVGDGLYGGSTRRMKRQALHGISLEFVHPWSGVDILVRAEPPEDFTALWNSIKNGARP